MLRRVTGQPFLSISFEISTVRSVLTSGSILKSVASPEVPVTVILPMPGMSERRSRISLAGPMADRRMQRLSEMRAERFAGVSSAMMMP